VSVANKAPSSTGWCAKGVLGADQQHELTLVATPSATWYATI
jgi:hypothetical protein